MKSREQIENLLVEKTLFLSEIGFENKIERGNIWSYRVSYLSHRDQIAIEFELDFRDWDIFVLVTYLEDGSLPKGYYMNNDGKRVRIHLEKLLELGKISQGEWGKTSKIRRGSRKPDGVLIENLIDEYCSILKKTASIIQELDVQALIQKA